MFEDPAIAQLNALCRRVEELGRDHAAELDAEDYTVGPGFLMWGRPPEPEPQPSLRERFASGVSTGLAAVAIALLTLSFMLLAPVIHL